MLLTLALTLFAFLQGGPSYSISGEVRDSEGKLACGVVVGAQQIDATPTTPRPTSHGTVTDASGRFVIKLDRAGTYRLIYQDEEHGYVPQYLPFFRDPNNPPPEVVLTDDSRTAQVNISMSRTVLLSGQAIDTQTQLPIDQVTFFMCHADNRSICWHISSKSADGNFSVRTPFVPFTLRIVSPEYEDWSGSQMSVLAGTNTPLRVLMRRKAEAINQVISEAEKRPGINLPAPKQLSPDDNQIFDIYPRVTKLEWEAIDGAVSYSVEVDLCEFRRNTHQCINPQPLTTLNPATSNLTKTSYEFSFIGAQPGRWRVWAVDKEGRAGFKSSWRTFVYLR